jgi:hypothetical protein
MDQYKLYPEGSYEQYTDPSTGLKCRKGQRGKQFVTDAELIADGFLQDLGGGEGENVGWENLVPGGYVITGARFRDGVRDLSYVLDCEIRTVKI